MTNASSAIPDGIGQAEYDAICGALSRSIAVGAAFTIHSVAADLLAAGWRHPAFLESAE